MTAAQTVLIKPLGGIAGDMFAGAAAALWPELVETCLADLAALDLPPGVSARFERVRVNGFAAQKFRVEIADATGPAVPTGAYPAIVERLERCGLAPRVLETALSVLRGLGEAEAAVHGKPLEAVHFHELADWDSIIDVTAAASFIARAPVRAWLTTSLPLGGGFAMTAHGRVPVPAPATLELLKGFDFHDDGVSGERVTPTGAAILRHLVRPNAASAPPRGRLIGAGFGAGDKRFEGLANVAQLVAFDATDSEDAQSTAGDFAAPMVEIAFDIDDMTGEEIAAALDRLRALDGVVEATQTPQIGKKGRALTLIRLLVAPPAEEAVVERCFLETSTLGLRLTDLRRRALPRKVAGEDGGRVKLAARPNARWTAKAESDDLASAETLADRRDRAARLEAAAIGAADTSEQERDDDA